MKIIKRGIAVAGRDGTDRQSCAFPGVCVLPNGRWLCSCRAAPRKNATTGQHVLLSWSDDEGASWSDPASPFVAPPVGGQDGLIRAAYFTALGGSRVLAALAWTDHSDPSLPLFNEETEGLLDMRVFLTVSEDNGESWSPLALIQTPPFDGPTPLTGPVLVLPDGEWACQFELNKAYLDPAPWRHSSVLSFSRDFGASWPEHVRVSDDPALRVFYWDQRPGVLSDGRLLDVFWTFDRVDARYLNMHARASRDNGRTWSDMWDTGVPGQPAAPVSIAGEKIALVYVDRGGAPEIKVRTSADGGRTWPAESERTIHSSVATLQTWDKKSMKDAWREMGRFSVGLPATALLPDGDILVVYYAGPETDRTSIEWARLRPDS